MRQAGIIAAGAMYALEHHVERLAEDHAHAQILAEAVRQCPGLTLVPETVDTNIVIFQIDPELGTAEEFAARLEGEGVLTFDIAGQLIRMVTHLDVSREDVERAAEIVKKIANH
jgi:threonine aldolase